MKKAVLILLAVAVLLVPAHARAGSESIPTGFKLVTGHLQSAGDPLVELANSDNDYADIASAGHDNVVKFDVSFTAVPYPPGTIGGKLEAHSTDTCVAKLALFAWNKKRWVGIGTTFGLPTTDVTLIRATDRTSRFLRNGRAKMRVTCTGNSPYTLSVDVARVLSS